MRDSIYVSGMPLLLRGYNGEYVKHPSVAERWDKHMSLHLGLIPIAPTWIIKTGDGWALYAKGTFGKSTVSISSELFGKWTGTGVNITVSPTNDIAGWWRSNSSITMFVATMAVLITAVCKVYQ